MALRTTMLAALLAASLAHGPARAAQDVQQTIPFPTLGSPQLAIEAWDALGRDGNGMFGYVFRIAGGGDTFALTTRSGATGLESFDLYFYEQGVGNRPGALIEPPHDLCPGGQLVCNKFGDVPANAAWAVVTLGTGANGTFRYQSPRPA